MHVLLWLLPTNFFEPTNFFVNGFWFIVLCLFWQGHLKEHSVKHSNERQYLCEICGSSFKTRAVQRKHIQTIHMNAGAYPCGQCEKTFSTRHAMKRHMKTHDTPGMRALQNMGEILTPTSQVPICCICNISCEIIRILRMVYVLKKPHKCAGWSSVLWVTVGSSDLILILISIMYGILM